MCPLGLREGWPPGARSPGCSRDREMPWYSDGASGPQYARCSLGRAEGMHKELCGVWREEAQPLCCPSLVLSSFPDGMCGLVCDLSDMLLGDTQRTEGCICGS